MNTNLTEDTQAILLLCGSFGSSKAVDPLVPLEYARLAKWLKSQNMRPKDLLREKNSAEIALESGLEPKRLATLLQRGVLLGFAVEEWYNNGIWVISRSDSEYPKRYWQHFGHGAPPLLFGAGCRSLLKGGGIAIVGSRDVDDKGAAFAGRVAEKCAANNVPVISGGARGVDKVSMLASIKAGGATVGVAAENLLRQSLSKDYRSAIAGGRLLLVSPYHPGASFNVGAAMGRNKLIYAMADFGLVVSATYNRGGTWEGAIEELKRESHRPVFVRLGAGAPAGNTKLLQHGAIAWPDKIDEINFVRQLSEAAGSTPTSPTEQSLFDYQEFDKSGNKEGLLAVMEPSEDEVEMSMKRIDKGAHTHMSIYEAVLPLILNEMTSPVTSEDLAVRLEVNKTQLAAWLKKAVADKKITKLNRPVRYMRRSNM